MPVSVQIKWQIQWQQKHDIYDILLSHFIQINLSKPNETHRYTIDNPEEFPFSLTPSRASASVFFHTGPARKPTFLRFEQTPEPSSGDFETQRDRRISRSYRFSKVPSGEPTSSAMEWGVSEGTWGSFWVGSLDSGGSGARRGVTVW